MATTVKFLGNTDDVTTCECCGRSDLKSTVALSIDESDAVYYGVTCAARALGRPANEIRVEARKADQEKARLERKAREERYERESAPWFSFLAHHGVGSDNFRRIESLGGYKAARAKFERAVAK